MHDKQCIVSYIKECVKKCQSYLEPTWLEPYQCRPLTHFPSPSDALSVFSLLYIGVNLVVYKLNVTGAV